MFDAVEFIDRLARLVPPPRKNVVRYYGALGPNLPLRPLVTEAARALSAGDPLASARRAVRRAGEALSVAARAWARCLSRVSGDLSARAPPRALACPVAPRVDARRDAPKGTFVSAAGPAGQPKSKAIP